VGVTEGGRGRRRIGAAYVDLASSHMWREGNLGWAEREWWETVDRVSLCMLRIGHSRLTER
jgi:hypothetical protein